MKKIVQIYERKLGVLFQARGMHILRFFSGSVILIFTFSVCITACAPKMEVPQKPGEVSKVELKQKAENAWKKKKYTFAEQFYQELLNRPSLSREEKIKSRRRLAYSAVENGNFSLARKNLDAWKKLSPDALGKWKWHQIVSKLKKRKDGDAAYKNYLKELLLKKDLAWSVKYQGLNSLNKYYLQEKDYLPLWRLQRKIYIQADKRKQKLKMEKDFIDLFGEMEKFNWERIQDSLPEGRMLQYPYSLLVWFSNINQLNKDKLDWSTCRRELGFILSSSELVNKEYLKSRLKKLEKKYGLPVLRIALMLPLQGEYKELGWNILRGLDVANWQYTRMEMDIRLQIINTTASNWKKRLTNLPSKYKFVGGPLRKNVWKKIYQEDIHKERVFFTFLSNINPGREGESAFRFFPGLKDQVRPLVDFCKKELDIDNFAILYPKSDYGIKRAKIFREEVAAKNGTLTALSGYSPDKRSGLKEVVANLLQVPEGYETKEKDGLSPQNASFRKRPDPDFKAVFLPDNFGKARILVPEFFYFGEDRLVFLGPAMWSLEIRRLDQLEYSYFDLSLMPGAWNSNRENRAIESLKQGLRKTAQGSADFWVGLGYDFLRFVHALKLRSQEWPPKDLKKELFQFSNFSWSMAPIHWNEKGKAKQSLFLLKPGSTGLVPVNNNRFPVLYNNAWEQ